MSDHSEWEQTLRYDLAKFFMEKYDLRPSESKAAVQLAFDAVADVVAEMRREKSV